MKSRILLIRMSALGDIIHALPALSALRKARPDAHIGWLVEDAGAPLLEGHPLLDTVHVLPRKAWRKNPFTTLAGPIRNLATELRSLRYDVAVDFQGLTKSAFWAKLCGAKDRIGSGGEGAKEVSRFFYSRPVHPAADQSHVIQKNLSLLRPLDVQNPEIEFHVHLAKESLEWGEKMWGDCGDRFARVVINLGAGWKTKRWPAAAYGRLAKALVEEAGARVVFAWGPGEETLLQTALEAVGQRADPPKASNADSIGAEPGLYALPPSTFTQLGAILRRAHLAVGGDTGPTHLAAALGIPTLGIYGASDAKRNGPWGAHCAVIQRDDPPCVPCWRTHCDWEEPLACLTHISVETVRDECLRLLAG